MGTMGLQDSASASQLLLFFAWRHILFAPSAPRPPLFFSLSWSVFSMSFCSLLVRLPPQFSLLAFPVSAFAAAAAAVCVSSFDFCLYWCACLPRPFPPRPRPVGLSKMFSISVSKLCRPKERDARQRKKGRGSE